MSYWKIEQYEKIVEIEKGNDLEKATITRSYLEDLKIKIRLMKEAFDEGYKAKIDFDVKNDSSSTKEELKAPTEIKNPIHNCLNCDNYLGFRGFCCKKCHDEHYDALLKQIDVQDTKSELDKDIMTLATSKPLKEIIEDIRNDPEAMEQARKLADVEDTKSAPLNDGVIELLRNRIKSCHIQLMDGKRVKGFPKEYVEGFRCRLDELLLLWHLQHDISFVEACKWSFMV